MSINFETYIFILVIRITESDDVVCNVAIYTDDTTLYSKCNQASDLWLQLELAFELESNLQDTVDWGSNAAKTQLILFDQLNNSGAIDLKMNGSVPGKTIFLRCWG